MKLIPLLGRGNEYLFNPEGSEVIWLSRFKKGFGRKQCSLFTTNTIDARQKRDELFATWLGEKPKVNKKVRQLAIELWREFEKSKFKKSPATQDSVKYSGKHFEPFFTELFPDQINEAWWDSVFIPTMRAEKKDRKFFNDWKWLSSFLKELHRRGVIEIKPRLENPDPDTDPGLYLSDEEIAALYEFGNADLKLQTDFGFKHFLRRSETLLMPYKEIDFKEGVLNLPKERTKIRKARTVPLSDAILSQLAARKKASSSPFVFPSPKNPNKSVGRLGNDTAWWAAVRRANNEKIVIDPSATFHDLRHSGLTRAFAATNKYLEVCFVAGLSLEEAQRTYLHLKPEHTRFVSSLVGTKSGATKTYDRV